MSFIVLPRFNEYPMSDDVGISTPSVIGIAVVVVAAVGLAVVLAVVHFRRRRQAPSTAPPVLPPFINSEKELISNKLQAPRPPTPLPRSVSRHNITPSIVLPISSPSIPSARPGPPKNTALARRPPSNADVLAHHEATGTMPQPFGPAPVSAPPASSPSVSAGASTPAPHVPSAHPSLDHAASLAQTVFSRPGSVVSFSRHSILTASLRRSSLRSSSLSSISSNGTATPQTEALRVFHNFTPLLPDELVVRRGERVAHVQECDDGWHIVGRRRAAWTLKTLPTSHGEQSPFGQAAAHGALEEVELGAVPAWVFQRGSGHRQRPSRSTSIGVTLVLAEHERREDVISWSNF